MTRGYVMDRSVRSSSLDRWPELMGYDADGVLTTDATLWKIISGRNNDGRRACVRASTVKR
jgi:hypothetical protein